MRLILLLLCTCLWATPTGAKELTIERLFSSPSIDGSLPSHIQFSKAGNRLSFLLPKKENYEVLDLWEFDFKTGKPHLLVDAKTLQSAPLSEEEKARRERMRISSKGIVEYFWSNAGDKIVFPAGEDLYLYSFGEKLKRLTNNPAAEIDVKFSADDRYVSFVRDQNLILLDLKSGKEFPVTSKGGGDLSYGVAEFIAEEEMDRFTGYWWSDDGKYIALTEVNEGPVKTVERYEISESSVTSRKERYPEAGSANAIVRLAVVKVDDVVAGHPNLEWVPIDGGPDIYLPRAEWTPDDKLAYQVQSRDQKQLTVYLYDPGSRKSDKVLKETDSRWVDLNDNWRWLKNSKLIWPSERNGNNQLFLVSRSGKVERPLTPEDWVVDEVRGVDETAGLVYFTAGMPSPLERHLFRVSLNNTHAPERLTQGVGFDTIQMDHDAKKFVRTFSSPTQPPTWTINSASGEQVGVLEANEINAKHPLFAYKDSFVVPEFASFRGPSGDAIYYRLYKPKNFDPTKKYPLIVMSYGGPTAQMVTKAWPRKSDYFMQILVDKGFLVATIDNRGSSRRSAKFSKAHYHAFGVVEVEDQKAGVDYLVSRGFVDKNRVGFFGWSYGGYLSVMLAEKAADTFHANVAVAPVTDFRFYDTHYTERYLGMPKDNKKIYDQADTLNFASKIHSRLLIMHGMADDNVLFTNSTMLFKKLQELGILYSSITYPGAKHGIYGRENQIHVYRSIADFFERNL